MDKRVLEMCREIDKQKLATAQEGVTAWAEKLLAELDGAKKDAARYRWLRNDKRGRSLSVSSLEWTGNAELSDAAVDAAMKEEGK